MKTSQLLNSNERLFCVLRKKWVADLPEEHVRQRLLNTMISTLGYPRGYLAVERELRSLPHLAGKTLVKRRIDLLCFAKDIHPNHSLYPLLIIECKAVNLTAKVKNQAIGYNRFVGAHFIAVANADSVLTGYYSAQKQGYNFIPRLPEFAELLEFLRPVKRNCF